MRLYHTTPSYNIEAILASGLAPQQEHNAWDFPCEEALYLSTSLNDARAWAEQIALVEQWQSFAIFAVDLPEGIGTKYRMSDLGSVEVLLHSPVSAGRIRLLDRFEV